MKLTLLLSGLFWFVVSTRSLAQRIQGLDYYHINSDKLFQSEQSIHILSINKSLLQTLQMDIVYSDTLTRLSDMAENNNALAAINGGFFNIKEGYSVSYLEKGDHAIARTENEAVKRKNPTWMLNGALIIDTFHNIHIEYSEFDSVYSTSPQESAVLGTGPILISEGQLGTFGLTKFTENRHPRSCICITEEAILLVVVDGRQRGAQGVSLFELQQLLEIFHCRDAINLDGGGSSALWLKEKGILNNPSDITGERKIANAVILRALK